MKRLEAEVRAKGMTVFARVDHAAGAAGVGLPLRPYLTRRHGLGDQIKPAVDAMTGALKAIASKATAAP